MAIILSVILAAMPQSAAARKLAKEAMEFLESRFAREVAEEGAERLEGRLAVAIERWGDDAISAARRIGPKVALQAVERHGAAGAKILAKWGDDGARLLAAEGDAAVKVYASMGDEGIAFLLRRQGTVGASLLPRMAEPIAASGRGAEFLAVMEKFGDRACQFAWRNKGVLFGAAVLAAFLSDPEPYLDGVRKLVAEPIRDIALEAARRTNWTLIVGAILAGVAIIVYRRKRKHADRPGDRVHAVPGA